MRASGPMRTFIFLLLESPNPPVPTSRTNESDQTDQTNKPGKPETERGAPVPISVGNGPGCCRHKRLLAGRQPDCQRLRRCSHLPPARGVSQTEDVKKELLRAYSFAGLTRPAWAAPRSASPPRKLQGPARLFAPDGATARGTFGPFFPRQDQACAGKRLTTESTKITKSSPWVNMGSGRTERATRLSG